MKVNTLECIKGLIASEGKWAIHTWYSDHFFLVSNCMDSLLLISATIRIKIFVSIVLKLMSECRPQNSNLYFKYTTRKGRPLSKVLSGLPFPEFVRKDADFSRWTARSAVSTSVLNYHWFLGIEPPTCSWNSYNSMSGNALRERLLINWYLCPKVNATQLFFEP